MIPKYKPEQRVLNKKTGALGIITSVYTYEGQTSEDGFHLTVNWFTSGKTKEYAEDTGVCMKCTVAHEEFEVVKR